MSDTSRNRTIIISVIALMFAVGGFVFNATPCNIAQGQTVCDVGDTETIAESLIVQNEFRAGSTPTAGESGNVLFSQGSGLPPEWRQIHGENIKVKTSDTSVTTDISLQQDSELAFGLNEYVNDGGVYVIRGMLIVESTTSNDFEFFIGTGALSGTLCVGETYDVATPDIIFLSGNFCGLDVNSDVTLPAGGINGLWFEIMFDVADNSPNITPTNFIDLIWSQDASSGTMTLYADSWIGLTKID